MKLQSKYFLISLCFITFIWSGTTDAVSVGSNTASSRQKRTFFNEAHDDNELYGFAVFEKGITLEDNVTTCSFDAFFPLSGDIVLNGGTFHMLRDLRLEKPFSIGAGTVDGNEFTIGFPDYVTGIDLPTPYHDNVFSFLDQEVMGQEITSIDWSHDGKYIAVASKSGINELKIYYVEDETLTLTLADDFGAEDLRSVKWHPSDYYLILGKTNSDEINTYYMNVSNGTLEFKDSFNAFTVNAVAWSPSGNHVAIGDASGSSVLVFAVSNGNFGASYLGALGATRSVQSNALSWNSTGDQLAVGLETGVGKVEVKVFEFSGSSLTANGEADIGGAAYSVGWIPGTDYLVVGLSASSERILVFEHDATAGTLTEHDSAYVGAGQKVYSLECNGGGNLVAVGKASSSDAHELELYVFDESDVTLSLCTGYVFSAHIKSVAWSPDDNCVVTGDTAGVLKLFKLDSLPLVFRDAKLFFKSDVTFSGPIVFEGTCLVNGGGNIFDFAPEGKLTVASGGSLVIEDVVMRAIGEGDICCADDTAAVTLKDLSWVQDSTYSFSVGSLTVKNDVFMSGENTFVYQSGQPFSILQNSTLELDMEFTFSYDPTSVASKTLFVLEDETSKLLLNGATLHATTTGLELSKGKLFVKDYANLSSEVLEVDEELTVDEGITLGDGTNDLVCKIYPGARLNISQGSLVYKNKLSTSWNMLSSLSVLSLLSDSQLVLEESLNLGSGVVEVGPQAYVTEAQDKSLIGSVFMVE